MNPATVLFISNVSFIIPIIGPKPVIGVLNTEPSATIHNIINKFLFSLIFLLNFLISSYR